MQFLSPWMLWGMLAVAAPILIHFWQRRQVVPLPFSTLKYLRVVAARTSRSAKLENLLLLLLRCLIFALLVLAASRPVVSKKALRLLGGNAQRTVVLIVDRSMSMGYRNGERTRLDVAREQALAVLDSLRPGDEAAVLAADTGAQGLVAQPTLDRGVAHRALGGVQGSEDATNFSAALVTARKIFAGSAKPVHEVYLFTDDQEGAWKFDPTVVFNDDWKKAEVSLVVVRPDEAAAVNAAVTGVKITSPLVTEGGRVNGVATVRNFSPAPLHDLLQITIGGTQVASLPVEGAANNATDVSFEFQMPANVGGHSARGVAKLQGDNLPADDRFFFTVPIHQAPRVVVVEGQNSGPERIHSGYYLRRALAAGLPDAAETPALPVGALEDAPLSGYSAVFLADPPRLSDRAAVKLDNYAKGGGTVVLMPGDSTDVSAMARVEFLPATALRKRELPIGRLSSEIVDPGNPLFANTWGPGTPFPPLPQRKLIEWKSRANLQMLVTAGGTEGFVMACDDGAGKIYIVNASPDRAWGDFPLSPAFLPLVQQIALQSSERGLGGKGYVVGQPVPAGPTLPRDQVLTITAPDASTQSVQLGEKALLLEHATQSGFYQVGTSADPALLTFETNVDGRESDLTPMAEGELAKISPHETVAGLDPLRTWLAQSRGMVPLWPWLVGLLALAFVAESVLSNLAARHRSQGDETHIKTGRLNRRRVGSPFRAAGVEAAAETVGAANGGGGG